jgi:hypothetical protein
MKTCQGMTLVMFKERPPNGSARTRRSESVEQRDLIRTMQTALKALKGEHQRLLDQLRACGD